LEARLWNEVFVYSQSVLGVPQGTIRATVLIETLLAAFEMDEILYELRHHSAGLNCGRWDYIFSYIKKLRSFPEFVLPDRMQVTMNSHFLKSYCQLLIQTCHLRGIHAMGGMAAQIPIKDDAVANAAAMDKVRLDKQREVMLGHDGTWVAHPGLISLARKVFEEGQVKQNQISIQPSFHKEGLRADAFQKDALRFTAADLLKAPAGEITEAGLQTNVRVSLFYLESWLRGVGCVPLFNLMEDAATVEISRAQIWQWIRFGKVKPQVFEQMLSQELKKVQSSLGESSYRSEKFEIAGQILTSVVLDSKFVEFITLPAYAYLN
jgi:malate synthase